MRRKLCLIIRTPSILLATLATGLLAKIVPHRWGNPSTYNLSTALIQCIRNGEYWNRALQYAFQAQQRHGV